MIKEKHKVYTKDILGILGCSRNTLSKAVITYSAELKKLNFHKYQRRFTTAQVNFLYQKFWGENFYD